MGLVRKVWPRCPRCHGKGKIKIKIRAPGSSKPHTVKQACPDCDGRGIIIRGRE